jgi:hypothetical protein
MEADRDLRQLVRAAHKKEGRGQQQTHKYKLSTYPSISGHNSLRSDEMPKLIHEISAHQLRFKAGHLHISLGIPVITRLEFA